MGDPKDSCTVAPPSTCNHATRGRLRATGNATDYATIDLKVAARKVLVRNQQYNQGATEAEKPCNSNPPETSKKLHASPMENETSVGTGSFLESCNQPANVSNVERCKWKPAVYRVTVDDKAMVAIDPCCMPLAEFTKGIYDRFGEERVQSILRVR